MVLIFYFLLTTHLNFLIRRANSDWTSYLELTEAVLQTEYFGLAKPQADNLPTAMLKIDLGFKDISGFMQTA